MILRRSTTVLIIRPLILSFQTGRRRARRPPKRLITLKLRWPSILTSTCRPNKTTSSSRRKAPNQQQLLRSNPSCRRQVFKRFQRLHLRRSIECSCSMMTRLAKKSHGKSSKERSSGITHHWTRTAWINASRCSRTQLCSVLL